MTNYPAPHEVSSLPELGRLRDACHAEFMAIAETNRNGSQRQALLQKLGIAYSRELQERMLKAGPFANMTVEETLAIARTLSDAIKEGDQANLARVMDDIFPNFRIPRRR